MSTLIQPGFNPAEPGDIGTDTPGSGAFTQLTVGGGTPVLKVMSGTGGIGTATIAAGAYGTVSIPATGATNGDTVAVALSASLSNGLVLANWFASTDEVVLVFFNTDLVSGQDLTGLSAYVTVFHH